MSNSAKLLVSFDRDLKAEEVEVLMSAIKKHRFVSDVRPVKPDAGYEQQLMGYW